jgi:hypothetical protein
MEIAMNRILVVTDQDESLVLEFVDLHERFLLKRRKARRQA